MSSHGQIMMRIVLVIVLLLGVLAGLLLSRQAKVPVLISRAAPPRISLEEKSHDLGTITQGNGTVYTFKLHNLGGEPLTVYDITADCPCIISNIRDRVIEPGKITNLDVILTPTEHMNGQLTQNIQVKTNDPTHPLTQLSIRALVTPDDVPPVH